MRVLLLGAGGMLGRDLAADVPVHVELVACTHAELDITDAGALERKIGDVRPAAIVNAAAYTAVDKAEFERQLAFRVNGEAVGGIGRVVARAGALVVHYSTDYVFDGSSSHPYREDDPVNPINVYGASKLAGERALQESGARFLILRTSWLFGAHGRSFPRTMWERARAGQATRVVNDQSGRPTYTVDLARATWTLVAMALAGVFHVTNTGIATWYELAHRVFSALGSTGLLTACSSEEYPTVARRPPYSVLDTSKTQGVLPFTPPSWESGIHRLLKELESENAGD